MQIVFIQMRKDGKRATLMAPCVAVPEVGTRVVARAGETVLNGDVLYVSHEIAGGRHDITVELRQEL
jgi:hypothetical protein